MKLRILSLSSTFAFVALWMSATCSAQSPRVLHEALHHLGDSKVEKWPGGVPDQPEGKELRFSFDARANAAEHCLVLRHYHVDNPWRILINGREVGRVEKHRALKDSYYALPAGALRSGKNDFAIVPTKASDDIVIGRVRLHARSFRSVLDLHRCVVRVRDPKGEALPARVFVTNAAGERAPLYYPNGKTDALRPGICYTSNGEAVFEVARGRYRIDVTRGLEWSHASGSLESKDGGDEVSCELRHEVDTRGYVAADTHIHTFEFSRHGDASLQERLVTLAGEGVELAISTDHNLNIDYRPEQRRLGLTKYYTSVVGNEVSTPMGHFNSFPLKPKDKIPEHRLTNWVKLIDGIRAKGARVVILNHPRWPSHVKGPYGRFRLNRLSGERSSGPKRLTFDAMELVNSTLKEKQGTARYVLRDWFALLNAGERVFAVGSSDSHTVGDPVGQGRTYVPSKTDDPAKIDVAAACDAMREGRTSISMGIFCDARVDGLGIGQTVRPSGESLELAVRVATPSWIRAHTLEVWANGSKVAQQSLPECEGARDDWIKLRLDTPAHDTWIVCSVLGDGVAAPCWRTFVDFTYAATNPIWIDADGQRGYESPRALAEALFKRSKREPGKLDAALASCDDALAVQVLAALRRSFAREERYARIKAFVEAMPSKRAVYARYIASLRVPESVRKAAGKKSG